MNCGSCGVAMSVEAQHASSHLMTIEAMGEDRMARLIEIFGGEAPKGLCGACFIATLGALNSGMGSKRQEVHKEAA